MPLRCPQSWVPLMAVGQCVPGHSPSFGGRGGLHTIFLCLCLCSDFPCVYGHIITWPRARPKDLISA